MLVLKKRFILFVLVVLNFSPKVQTNSVEIINGHGLPDYVLRALTQIGLKSGESTLSISSKNRTVKQQVEVMLDYYILCTKGRFSTNPKACGINLARQVYHSDCHGGFDAFNHVYTKTQNIQLMSKALAQSLRKLGESRTCMNHVVVPGIKTKYIAVDIKPSSIKNRRNFYKAVRASEKVKRFFYPPISGVEPSQIKESAFHLEFERKTIAQ